MFIKSEINTLDDFFHRLSERKNNCVYFYRIADYNEKIDEFLAGYAEAARRRGVIVIGKIPNPDEKQLSYYEEIMGLGFKLDAGFLNSAMSKWLPRINNIQRENITCAIYDTLSEMSKLGKNENILKNAYIKFMCWLYYKFERILNFLGDDDIPKILYEGDISQYELKMLSVISKAGCDVVLLEKNGDSGYLKVDKDSEESVLYKSNGGAFPAGYSIEGVLKRADEYNRVALTYNSEKARICSTNTWISGDVFEDCLKPYSERGNDDNIIYNMFVRVKGINDKASYMNELFRWKMKIQDSGRKVFVLNEIPQPNTVELSGLNGVFSSRSALLEAFAAKLDCSGIEDLTNQARKAFVDIMLEQSRADGDNLNRLKNKAVYMIAYFQRYSREIFKGFKWGNIPVFIYFGVCLNKFEALFIRLLSYLPVDVFIINTDLSRNCMLEDKRLFEKVYEYSAETEKFPESLSDIKYSTAAYNAERDLDSMLYENSGLYRDRQYKKAVSIPVHAMYEELYILWDQELKYRPGFDIINDEVVMPSLFCKVSGVKDGDIAGYWSDVKKLCTKDTIVIDKVPFINCFERRGGQTYVPFLKNAKLQRDKLKSSSAYKYGIFREETQEYMLDKLQALIDSEAIKGTFTNGIEYTIMDIVLNLDVKITRLIQNFDFTKVSPKVVILAVSDKVMSIEDSIFVLYLSMAGFDIAMFVPTGYRVIENYYTKPMFNEYQTGEFMYDLVPPVLDGCGEPAKRKVSILGKLFGRER